MEREIDLEGIIRKIPEGYRKVLFKGQAYGLSRKDFNQGKSTKVYAEELGGRDFISFNYYFTSHQNLLKPCEMPKSRVIDFMKAIDSQL